MSCVGRAGPEGVREPSDVRLDVEALYHGAACPTPQATAELSIVEEAAHGGGQSLRIARGHEEPVDAVGDELPDRRKVRRHDRETERHGLHQDVGDAVDVAVRGSDTGEDDHRGLPVLVDHGLVRQRAREKHDVTQRQGDDQPLQLGPLRAAADDAASEAAALAPQHGARRNEMGEALPLRQLTHRQHERETVVGRGSRAVPVQVETMRDGRDLPIQPVAYQTCEVRLVVGGTRHHVAGGRALLAEQDRSDEDVGTRVDGQGERPPQQPRRHQRDRGRPIGEVCVQLAEVAGVDDVGGEHTLAEVEERLGAGPMVGVGSGDEVDEHADVRARPGQEEAQVRGEERAPCDRKQVGRPPGERPLLARKRSVGRRAPDGEDPHVQPPTSQGRDLPVDERGREQRIGADDVHDGTAQAALPASRHGAPHATPAIVRWRSTTAASSPRVTQNNPSPVVTCIREKLLVTW